MSTERNIPQKIVYILLAAFNGERFIREQISSIRNQTYVNWKLIIRDDGSTDKTKDIILECIQDDSRIVLLDNSDEQRGCVQNFNCLMEYAVSNSADYIFFADQDDVWSPEKVSILMDKMEILEGEYTKDTPLLAYSDLEVVDERLNVLNSSYMTKQRLSHPKNEPLSRLLVENTVTGCAMLINRALLQIAHPIPDLIVIHDWWIALCAAMTGKVYFVEKSLIKYRQHDNNVIGLTSYTQIFNPTKLSLIKKLRTSHENFCSSFKQAEQLLSRTTKLSPIEHVQYVKKFGLLGSASRYQRLVKFKKLKLNRSNWLTNLLLLIHIVFLRRKVADELK